MLILSTAHIFLDFQVKQLILSTPTKVKIKVPMNMFLIHGVDGSRNYYKS